MLAAMRDLLPDPDHHSPVRPFWVGMGVLATLAFVVWVACGGHL
jgi:hypothetical protein